MMAREVTPYTASLASSSRGSLLSALASAFAFYCYFLGVPILPEVDLSASTEAAFTGLPSVMPAVDGDESTYRSNHLQREGQTLVEQRDPTADYVRLQVGNTRSGAEVRNPSIPRADDQMAHSAN